MPIYAIAAVALLGVVVRPWQTKEVWWAVAGACALTLSGLLPWKDAVMAAAKGSDVYMFLIGMMLLSALADREGLFDHLAALCVSWARGSAPRLFLLVYGVGTAVTVFMSNDATAVVLTPAVLAVCNKAKARPLPYLLACALVANAASFVLPISNPANLVVHATALPALDRWLGMFLLPSVLSIVVTFAVLRWLSRDGLTAAVDREVTVPRLSVAGRLAGGGVALTAAALLFASAFDVALGAPALLTATVVWLVVSLLKRQAPRAVVADVSWSIVPLVAGLFVIVEGLQHAGLLRELSELLRSGLAASTTGTALTAGVVVAFACNLMNNLPAGLVAGSAASAAGASVDPVLTSAVTIGIDLGPNLSVTGSLATILWLVALRRQGVHVSGWTFFKTGVVAMPLALAAAFLGLWLQRSIGH